MGANYSFYVKTIETHALAFLALNILAIGRVTTQGKQECSFIKNLNTLCLFPGYLIFHVGIGTSVVNSRMEKVVWGLPEKNEKEISFNNSKLECHFRQNFDPIGATRIIRIIFFSNNNKKVR